MDSQPLKSGNPWPIAFAVGIAVFMVVLDTSVANVSLPYIAGNLSASIDESTWVLTSFLVANAIVLPLGGYFSGIFGRKRFYMAGILCFTISSVLCGMAPSLNWLIIFRIFQGFGGGILQPTSQAILVESFPHEKRGMAMAMMGIATVFAPIIGPVLGGWITENYSWHWIFFINVPPGILSLILISILVHDPPSFKRFDLSKGFKVDYLGIGMLALGLASLEYALDEGQRHDWFASNLIIVSMAVGIIALIVVIFHELRLENPVLDLRLMKDRNFSVSMLFLYVLGFALYGSLSLLPIFLQTLLGYSAIQSGWVLSPGGMIILVMMPIVALLMKKLDNRFMIAFGYFFCFLGLYWMAQFNLQVDYKTCMLARVVQCFGLAFLFVPINVMAFQNVPPDKIGYASGLLNLVRNYGGSTGIALITTLLSRRTQLHQVYLSGNLTSVSIPYRNFLARGTGLMMAHGTSMADSLHKAQGLSYMNLLRQSGMMSFADVFWGISLLCIFSVPLLFLVQIKKGAAVAPVVVSE
ncbi:MAG: DHA2 family efflux MFS transporter permease subunit [Candidatus Riflebacteria bacterium]|nr:DHA2 family efflux MFS transporter permease subunit [Candidatus Riflebacteria bacterium]